MIEKLTDSCLDEIMDVERRCHSHPASSQAMANSFSDRYFNFGIRVQGRLAGFYIVEQVLDEISLHDICVLPELRRQQLGERLLKHCLEAARNRGASQVFLEVRESNAPAVKLYQRNGFEITAVRRNYYPAADGREDALMMHCKLK